MDESCDSGTARGRLPVACSLSAGEQTDRRRAWQALADHALIGQWETARGVRLSLSPSPEVEAKLRELASLERECCGFASWRVESRDRALILDVSAADDDAAEMIRAMFG